MLHLLVNLHQSSCALILKVLKVVALRVEGAGLPWALYDAILVLLCLYLLILLLSRKVFVIKADTLLGQFGSKWGPVKGGAAFLAGATWWRKSFKLLVSSDIKCLFESLKSLNRVTDVINFLDLSQHVVDFVVPLIFVKLKGRIHRFIILVNHILVLSNDFCSWCSWCILGSTLWNRLAWLRNSSNLRSRIPSIDCILRKYYPVCVRFILLIIWKIFPQSNWWKYCWLLGVLCCMVSTLVCLANNVRRVLTVVMQPYCVLSISSRLSLFQVLSVDVDLDDLALD